MGKLTSEQARELQARRRRHGARRRSAVALALRDALDRERPLSVVIAQLAAAVDEGQPWAIMLWLAYLVGKPVERRDVNIESGLTLGIIEEIVDVK